MSRPYDVVIIGGGPAGSAAAITLARAKRKVLLIDAPIKNKTKKIGESLPGSAKPLLVHLGLDQIIENGPHLKSYGNGSAWGSDDIITTDFIKNPQGAGWHLDRVRFDSDLRKAAKAVGTEIKIDRVKKLKKTAAGWDIALEKKGKLTCHWLIDVTGRSAFVAKTQGVTRLRDDSLAAIYAWMPVKKNDHDSRTLIESAPQGWWYTAKLPDKTRIVAFHTDAKDLSVYLKSKTKWKGQLANTKHIKAMLGTVPTNIKLYGHEACGAQLKSFSGDRWISAGDAAMSFDPLSSQGIFNALYTGMKAAEAVDKSLGGVDDLVVAYSEDLQRIRTVYLERKKMFYAQEQRWPGQRFWKSRF